MSDAVFFARFPGGAFSSGSAPSSSGSRTLLFIDFVAVSVSQLGFMLAGNRRARKGERKDGGWMVLKIRRRTYTVQVYAQSFGD